MNAIEIIRQHIPSLADEDEQTIDGLRFDPENDAAELGIRTCKCNEWIGGYYEYADHLIEMLKQHGYTDYADPASVAKLSE